MRANLLRIVVILICLVIAYFMIISMGAMGLLFSMPFVLIAGIALSGILGGAAGDLFGNILFGGGNARKVEEFSLIKGKVTNHDYQGAIEDLRTYISINPDSLDAKKMLMSILYDHLDNKEEALELAQTELQNEELSDDHESIVNLTVDILLEKNRRNEAVKLLQLTVDRLPHPASENIQKRLSALTGTNSV